MPRSHLAPARLDSPSAADLAPPDRRRQLALTAECARRLRAAHDASAHDEEQQLLIRELMAHYRSWCLAQAYPDPFVALEPVARPERIGRAEWRMQQLNAAAIRRGTAPTPVDELHVPPAVSERSIERAIGRVAG